MARLFVDKDVSSLELGDAAIERLERVNGSLNAVITPMFEEARSRAADHDGSGTFADMPFLVKDLLAEVRGVRFTEAVSLFGDLVPNEDSGQVRRFRAEGLQFIGKTNTPEFAIGATTEPHRFGATHNPSDTERTPKGVANGCSQCRSGHAKESTH